MFKMFSRPEFPSYVLQTYDLEDPLVLTFQVYFNKRASKYGIHIIETGIYDMQTRLAVSSFQLRSLGIVNADGFVGPQTAQKLKIRLIEDEQTEVTPHS